MSDATVLLLGSGGREHALAWKLSQSPSVDRIICIPGNPGMASLGELRSVNVEDINAVVALATEVRPDLVVVGPEAPIAAGVSDALCDAGFLVFGPSRAAGRLEWDKDFAKSFMVRHGVPTASSKTFSAEEVDAAREYVKGHSLPVVLKANGLAAGKGVVIAESIEEALTTLDAMLSGSAFGDAGRSVVIEEFMYGEEASVFAVVDRTHYMLFAPSQDHKRIGDGDTGPNTGGMGAYAPAPIVSDERLQFIRERIVEPTIRGMREEGNPFHGCLFCGLMIGGDRGVRVVEFNSRFGDPETQVILPIWRGDLYKLFHAAASGTLSTVDQGTSVGSAVCVVMASGGYPGSYEKGKVIEGLDDVSADTVVFHAGTKRVGDDMVTNGGRVLGVTSVSSETDMEQTILRAYEEVSKITFDGAVWRHDIGARINTDRDTD